MLEVVVLRWLCRGETGSSLGLALPSGELCFKDLHVTTALFFLVPVT